MRAAERRCVPAVVAVAAALALTGCAGSRRISDDNAPTLASLAGRKVDVAADGGLPRDEARAIAAYQAFLAGAPRDAPQRGEAMRRLADLEMDLADKRLSDGEAPDYRAAIARYQALLQAHPQGPAEAGVLYQLARAQEQGGDLEAALSTLDHLVRRHPNTTHRDEAEFRRGELLFAKRRYADAEAAFATVLQAGAGNPYLDRALYMQGWSRYKQGATAAALEPLFGVLDIKLGAGDEAALSRADQELVDDTLRVVALSLEGLQGAAGIAPHVQGARRQGWAWRVYTQLGELYLHQGRAKDAADTFALFARLAPGARQAAAALARVVEIYGSAGFAALAMQARRDYVLGPGRQPAGPAEAARVRRYLDELAQHHHAEAQRTREAAATAEAARWYRASLAAFADDAAPRRFLLGELLTDAGRHAEALPEYEAAAYGARPHPRAGDAGYAALTARAALLGAAAAADRPPLQRAQAQAGERYAAAFPSDPRVAAVLTDAADQWWRLRESTRATALARRVVALPAATPAQRRVAATVLAHAAFEAGDFAAAERGYGELQGLIDDGDPARREVGERLAASIYRQGEAARTAGRGGEAVRHFARVAQVAPQSSAAATALFDAAAQQIALADWAAAGETLETLRRRHAGHALAAEVPAKLARVYLELGRPGAAAAEFARLADTANDPETARAARWQAAELHQQARDLPLAIRGYEQYLRAHPQPLAPAAEARWRLAEIAREQGRTRDEQGWLRGLQQAVAAGSDGDPRSRTLAALATIRLAEPQLQAYRQVALVEPLKRSLDRKKARYDELLAVYARAAEAAGTAEAQGAATFHAAELAADFGRAVLASQKPRGLRKAEAEQYQVLLEEQAFPFEERAVALHQLNAERTLQGRYDEWVRKSYGALRSLRPLRWARAERGGDGSSAAAAANREGIAHREAGRFEPAREAYRRALALDARLAGAELNLAILLDLYFHDGAAALPHYDAFQRLSGGDATVARWIAELSQRKPRAPAAATAATAAVANTAAHQEAKP